MWNTLCEIGIVLSLLSVFISMVYFIAPIYMLFGIVIFHVAVFCLTLYLMIEENEYLV